MYIMMQYGVSPEDKEARKKRLIEANKRPEKELGEMGLMEIDARKRKHLIHELDERGIERAERIGNMIYIREPSQDIVYLMERVGTVPFMDAMTLHFDKRPGRRVITESQKREDSDKWKLKLEHELERAKRDNFVSSGSTQIPRDILEGLRARGERMSSVEYCSACVFAFGMSPTETDKYGIKTESNLVKYLRASRLFGNEIIGYSSKLLLAVRNGILEEMHDYLFKSPPDKRVFDTFELEKRLRITERCGTTPDVAYDWISSCGAVLEKMGLLKKLPTSSTSHGKVNPNRWIHSAWADRYQTIPRDNLDYVIMSTLYEEGELQQHEFSTRRKIFGEFSTGSDFPFNIGSVRQAVGRLEKDGLVITEKRGEALFVRLTRTGREIMHTQEMQNIESAHEGFPLHLTEELREALLGIHTPGLKGEEMRTMDRIVYGVMILRRLDEGKNPAGIIHDIYPGVKKEHGEYHNAMTYIIALKKGTRPWKGISIEKIEHTYIPAIRVAEEESLVEAGTAKWLVDNVVKPTREK